MNNGVRIIDDRIKIPKIGLIKVFNFKPINGKLISATISKSNTCKYYISICYDSLLTYPTPKPIQKPSSVGIDVGIKDFIILNDGTKIGNPKFYEQLECRIQFHQKNLSRKIKGSNRYKREKCKISKLHEQIKNSRDNFIHQLTNKLTTKYDTICIEDLDINGLLEKHQISKSIQSVSWGEFFRQLEYKCLWRGKNLIRINRFDPSTKRCSSCGYIKNTITLGDRDWSCPSCNSHHDRDINAANNILYYALNKKPMDSRC